MERFLRIALQEGLRTSSAATVAVETQRMDVVNRNFRIIKVAEMVCISFGVLLVAFLPHPSSWAAVGLGVLVEAAVLLVFDAFAHQRALVYTQWLQGVET